MTSTPPDDAPRRRPILVPVVAILAAVTVGVSAAFGGLKDAPEPQPEQLGKGAEFDQGQMKTVFEDAVVRPGDNQGLGISDKRYLQIMMKVTNESDETILAQTMDRALPTIRADDKTIKPGKDPSDLGPRIVTLYKGHSYSQLHPGVPETVVMSFELGENDPVPEKVSIDAATFEWQESFIQQTHAWVRVVDDEPPTPEERKRGQSVTLTPKVGAQVTLPVRVEGGL
ncbi:hypothetical protein [Sphaerisporangium fuscum]|uniref:hypothetical protein n=1 Tax=Sphaerisporangium fuscum TaxID=2835868 RepID=UPI001BDCA4E6|nr:hypothetical protein [Sphaerisporangium fuscum]